MVKSGQLRRLHMYRTMDCDQLGEEVEYLEAEVSGRKNWTSMN
jgi:hypothetical protein